MWILFLKNYLFCSYIRVCVCFQPVAFVRGHPMRLPYSYGLVPHMFWQKQQAGNIHVCKNKIDNSRKIQTPL